MRGREQKGSDRSSLPDPLCAGSQTMSLGSQTAENPCDSARGSAPSGQTMGDTDQIAREFFC